MKGGFYMTIGEKIILLRTKAGLSQEELGEKLNVTGVNKQSGNFYVRVPVFSFEKLNGVDMLLGEKTKSTGDVMGIGDTFDNALLKGMIASGMRIKRTGSILVCVNESDKSDTVKMAEEFLSQGFKIYATSDARTTGYLLAKKEKMNLDTQPSQKLIQNVSKTKLQNTKLLEDNVRVNLFDLGTVMTFQIQHQRHNS